MDGINKNLVNSIISVLILSIIAIAAVAFLIYDKIWVGPIFIFIGAVHILAVKLFKIKTNNILPDIIFGAIDNGFLVVGAVIGADFAGILGAVVGAAAANAITDGIAGIFEGWAAEHSRKHKIKEERTALSSAIGKMAGCFFGAGIAFVIAWTILSL